MHKKNLIIFIFILNTLFIPINNLFSQSLKNYIHIDHLNASLFDYMINAGEYTPHFVLQQPYHFSLFDSAASNRQAVTHFKKRYNYLYHVDGIKTNLQLGERLKSMDGDAVNRYLAAGSLLISYPHITLFNRTALDQEYKYDPNYAGDLSEAGHWLYGRVNDAYMNINISQFNLFIGRMQRNWGLPDSYSLLLSNHPYSYDHVLFSYHNNLLKLSLIFARLEDLSAYEQPGFENPDSLIFHPNARKFLVGHRLDFHFSDHFQIGFTELTTYGGPDRDFELSFINPMTFYYGLQRNDGLLNNGKWALDLFYKPKPKITLYGQFLIDDVIVNNEPGQDDRANLPDRLGMNISVRSGDLLLPGLNSTINYIRIWNRTYQSRWTWENYHYRGLGLGYPCAGCEEVKLKLGYWGQFPLLIQNEFIIGRYGDVSLTDVFKGRKEDFPVPPITKNIVNRFSAYYFYNPQTQFFLTLESYKDPDHYLNRLNQGASFMVSLGFRYLFGYHYNK